MGKLLHFPRDKARLPSNIFQYRSAVHPLPVYRVTVEDLSADPAHSATPILLVMRHATPAMMERQNQGKSIVEQLIDKQLQPDSILYSYNPLSPLRLEFKTAEAVANQLRRQNLWQRDFVKPQALPSALSLPDTDANAILGEICTLRQNRRVVLLVTNKWTFGILSEKLDSPDETIAAEHCLIYAPSIKTPYIAHLTP